MDRALKAVREAHAAYKGEHPRATQDDMATWAAKVGDPSTGAAFWKIPASESVRPPLPLYARTVSLMAYAVQ